MASAKLPRITKAAVSASVWLVMGEGEPLPRGFREEV